MDAEAGDDGAPPAKRACSEAAAALAQLAAMGLTAAAHPQLPALLARHANSVAWCGRFRALLRMEKKRREGVNK